jgi:GMP synthase (glutamine-hydrolysing)
MVAELKKVQDDKVVLGLSGGVDSTVAAVLLFSSDRQKSLLYFLSIMVCFARTISQVLDQYKGMGLNVKSVDAGDRFFVRIGVILKPSVKLLDVFFSKF